MPCQYITDLAVSIWTDLGQPTGQPPSYIQSKLVSPPYVGKLNNLLATCYVAVSGDISPPLGEAEQGIFSYLYQTDYYTTALNRVLAGLNPGVTLIRDGDSQVTFTNPVDIARIYRDARSEAVSELYTQVYAYRQMASQPSAVDMPTIINVPGAWGAAGGGYNPAQYPYGYYRE